MIDQFSGVAGAVLNTDVPLWSLLGTLITAILAIVIYFRRAGSESKEGKDQRLLLESIQKDTRELKKALTEKDSTLKGG